MAVGVAHFFAGWKKAGGVSWVEAPFRFEFSFRVDDDVGLVRAKVKRALALKINTNNHQNSPQKKRR